MLYIILFVIYVIAGYVTTDLTFKDTYVSEDIHMSSVIFWPVVLVLLLLYKGKEIDMFRKFYCEKCNAIKPRYGVKKEDDYYCYRYYCKYCHNQVMSVDTMLIRMYEKLQKRTRLEELDDLHEWIKSEAKERYPNSKVGKAAFKAGIYALLDKIGFDYESGED